MRTLETVRRAHVPNPAPPVDGGAWCDADLLVLERIRAAYPELTEDDVWERLQSE